MHDGATWRLLRHLLDETKTKSFQHGRLAEIIMKETRKYSEQETKRRLLDKYIPEPAKDDHPDHSGPANEQLDRDIEVWKVKAPLLKVNSKSAAGSDRITNEMMQNLSDEAIEAVT